MHSDLLAGLPPRRSRLGAAAAVAVVAAAAVALLVWPRVFASPVGATAAMVGPSSATRVAGAATGAQAARDRRPHRRGEGRDVGEPAAAARAAATASPASPDAETEAVAQAPGLVSEPLGFWLEAVADDAGRALLVGPGVDGTLRATLGRSSPVPWQTRLEAYARVSGFGYQVGEGLIEVWAAGRTPRQPTQLAAGSPAATGAAETDDDARSGGRDPPSRPPERSVEAPALPDAEEEPAREARVVRLDNARAEELAKVLARAAKAGGASVAADAATNSLVVSGPPRAVAESARLAGELDLPRRRILLEVRIVELSRSARSELGIQWSLGGEVGALVDLPAADVAGKAAALLVSTTGAHGLDARLAALESAGQARVVSQPRVVVLEGSDATIESVRILRIRLPSRGAVVGDEVVEVGDSAGRATEEVPVGVRLEVTPSLHSAGRVRLRIRAKSSSLGPPLPPDDIPEEVSRMVSAELMVSDGETAVLGGLSREGSTHSGTGVPVLRDIPLLGTLFGQRSQESDSEELLILVRPTLLDRAGGATAAAWPVADAEGAAAAGEGSGWDGVAAGRSASDLDEAAEPESEDAEAAPTLAQP